MSTERVEQLHEARMRTEIQKWRASANSLRRSSSANQRWAAQLLQGPSIQPRQRIAVSRPTWGLTSALLRSCWENSDAIWTITAPREGQTFVIWWPPLKVEFLSLHFPLDCRAPATIPVFGRKRFFWHENYDGRGREVSRHTALGCNVTDRYQTPQFQFHRKVRKKTENCHVGCSER